ncbi:uncharacterized protein BKCO1_37000119 [Diplodia corticola]|uniref:Uncharacterized protein n=1 Tax=Diplodia corticola TaxID=236234 RepID=A0A1J9RYL2_9PEZI|nr:uncharacterized protein BKCO1_37000119 [Diplodia corticola]OJD32533.1 hypothetical protein BKCO1_37000119 [Diplodia corticola]
MIESCKGITTKGVSCTANAVKNGYCILHSKRHAQAIRHPILLSPHPDTDAACNKPLPHLPSSNDSLSFPRRRRCSRTKAIKSPKHKGCDLSDHPTSRWDTISPLDADFSEGEEITIQLVPSEEVWLSLSESDSAYGSDDSTGSIHSHRSTASSHSIQDSPVKFEPYYMGALWRGNPPDGVIVVGDKDSNRIRRSIRQDARRRHAKNKHGKMELEQEHSEDGQDNNSYYPSPMRWPFSSPTSVYFAHRSEQNEEEGSYVENQTPLYRRRRGIISEINIAIDSLANHDDRGTPFPFLAKVPCTHSIQPKTKKIKKLEPSTLTAPILSPYRFQPLRSAPLPPPGGSATATALGILSTNTSPLLLSSSIHSSRHKLPVLISPPSLPSPHSASLCCATPSAQDESDEFDEFDSGSDETAIPQPNAGPGDQPLPTLNTRAELEYICNTLLALRLQWVDNDNLALDGLYRLAWQHIRMVGDTHGVMEMEERKGLEEQGVIGGLGLDVGQTW